RRTNALGMTQELLSSQASGIFLLASSALASGALGFPSAAAELSAGDADDADFGSSALGVLEPQPTRARRVRTMQVRMGAPYHFVRLKMSAVPSAPTHRSAPKTKPTTISLSSRQRTRSGTMSRSGRTTVF